MGTSVHNLALIGPAGGGKDTFVTYAKQLPYETEFHVYRAALADELKLDFGRLLMYEEFGKAAVDLMPERAILKWVNEQKADPRIRAYLQGCGEAMCAIHGESYWVYRMDDKIRSSSYSPGWHSIVVTDCRKQPEADTLRQFPRSCSIVEVVPTFEVQGAGITEETAKHRSETERLLIRPDYRVYNPGDTFYRNHIEYLVKMLTDPELPSRYGVAERVSEDEVYG